MAKREKLLSKAKRNPSGLTFDELETLLAQSGWVKRQQEGSHHLWYSPGGFRLPVQPAGNGKAKGYQVKQFLARHENEADDE